MAPELRPQPPSLVPVHPDEEARVGSRCCAIGHPVRPVLRQAVIFRRGGQTAVRDGQPHRHVRPAAGNVIAPQRRHRFLHAALACHHKSERVFSFQTTAVTSWY